MPALHLLQRLARLGLKRDDLHLDYTTARLHDGTQAEYVRVPSWTNSTYVVAVVGADPIGLATIMTARLVSPAHIIAIDLADARLEAAKRFGADVIVNNGREDALEIVRGLTDGLGADVSKPTRP